MSTLADLGPSGPSLPPKTSANRFIIGKSPLLLFDHIHRQTNCRHSYHDFVSRQPPLPSPDSVSDAYPVNILHEANALPSTSIAKRPRAYICKRCLFKIIITNGNDEDSTGHCLFGTGSVKHHHWHTVIDEQAHDGSYWRSGRRKSGSNERIEKCCQCDMTVTIRIIPCVLNSILPKLRDELEKATFPVEAHHFMGLFLQISRDCEKADKDFRIKTDCPSLIKKVGDYKQQAISLFQFLGFEEADDAWYYREAKRNDAHFKERAEILRDELTILYEKNRARIPDVPFCTHGSDLWDAAEHIAARLHVSFHFRKNGFKSPASMLIKDMEKSGCDWNLGGLGLLNYYPDDTDDHIIWAYSLNSKEGGDQIPQLMDNLVEVMKWKNTEELQQFVAIERSQGNHPLMDIRAAFRVLRIEDAHMGIHDAALCRNFEWTFLSSNPPGNVEEAKQALKLIGEARRSDIIQNFAATGELPPDESPAVLMEIDEKEIQVPAGLDNIGNTCFLNSLLQCYFAIKPLRDAVLSFVPPPSPPKPTITGEPQYNNVIIPNDDTHMEGTLGMSVVAVEIIPRESFATLNEGSTERPKLEVPALDPPSTVTTQLTSQDPSIRIRAAIEEAERAKELMLQMQILFASLIWTNKVSITPQKVLADIALTSEGLRFGLQQDVGECHSRMMASLEIALKSGLNESNASLINNLFTGKFQQKLEYTDEESGEVQARTQGEDFSFLLLNVARDLNEALDAYFTPELLGDFKGAKPSTPAVKYTTITQVPPVLMINIQRSMFDKKTNIQYKEHQYTNYPPRLYLDRFMETNDSQLAEKQKCDIQWRNDIMSLEQCRAAEAVKYRSEHPNFVSIFEDARDYLSQILPDDQNKRLAVDMMTELHHVVVRQDEQIKKNMGDLANQRKHLFDEYRDKEYHLQAVFMHEGEANFGHYWLYLYDPAGQRWFKCNDSRVTVVPEAEVFSDTSGLKKSAYCLVNATSRAEYEQIFPKAKELVMEAARPSRRLHKDDQVDSSKQERVEVSRDCRTETIPASIFKNAQEAPSRAPSIESLD
ncbi:hypothetical protein SeLEV6574_g01608 [Synchytrium endobioticum]|uniref:ubiquitinyl hydrolase 1 n=1 Tax=Synchytrium endobioticum TaxID=286115 RepID=A0A507DEB0_9FUNG|nr:hypothetical protein SeLEV6574_g01608 [Synchytrium endobioticum]